MLTSAPMVAGSRLAAVAAARPQLVCDAAELGAPFGKDAAWVTSRTGITRLHRLGPDDSLADLAVAAGRGALKRAGLDDPVDLVITASCSTEAGYGQRYATRLAPDAAWLELNSACSGFCYAVSTADALIRVGDARAVLIVAAEQMSRTVDPADLGTSIIFADGAGAAVVIADATGPQVGPLVCGTDGAAVDLITTDDDGYLRMQGSGVFRWAVETVPKIAEAACHRAGVDLSDIEVFVPHQANLRIIEAVVRNLGLTDTVVATDVAVAGNTSAASIPLAIDALLSDEPSLRGRLALLVGFGAGLSYAAQVVRMPA